MLGEKNVAPARAQTCIFCSLGECPNHLDHQVCMLFTCHSSSLRAYWPGPRDLDLEHCHLQFIHILAHLHTICRESLCLMPTTDWELTMSLG